LAHPRVFLAATLIFVLSACNISSPFSITSSADNQTTEPEIAQEDQAAIDAATGLEDTKVSAATELSVVAAPTALPAELIAKADAEEILLINIYERVNPSVVNILVTVEDNQVITNNPFPAQGQGSGFIVDAEGHVVTNNHVIADAKDVEVTFYDGTTVSAEVIGTDADSDLAVIKVNISPENLRPISWGDSNQILVGQRAVAIGNPFGLDGTLTTGIISALGRSLPTENNFLIPEIVQTDAAINPGNSGGPLLNSRGEVIGVNTAIVPNRVGAGERSFLGVGFAVPSNMVRRIVTGLIADGEYHHPWIGFSGNTVTPEIAETMKLPSQIGALVAQVISGSPADDAGLRGATRDFELDNGRIIQIGGDVITKIDGQTIKTFDDLLTFLSREGEVDKVVTLTILRDGKEQQVELTLGARPARVENN